MNDEPELLWLHLIKKNVGGDFNHSHMMNASHPSSSFSQSLNGRRHGLAQRPASRAVDWSAPLVTEPLRQIDR